MFEQVCKTPSGAIFSEDRLYRWILWRVPDPSLPIMSFVGLNPSVANEVEPDNTIKRITSYAKAWGYGGFVMLNCFAWVSTDRSVLATLKQKAVGEHNDAAIRAGIALSRRVVLGWGNDATVDNRASVVMGLVKRCVREMGDRDICVLKWTSAGQPWHPLYLPKNIQPITVAT